MYATKVPLQGALDTGLAIGPVYVLPDANNQPVPRLVLALPHTKQSDGMVGERELRALPRTAYLLNPARGPIVQEQALVEALRQEFSLPVELLNPFKQIVPPSDSLENEILEQNPGQLAVAVGLALRSFENL